MLQLLLSQVLVPVDDGHYELRWRLMTSNNLVLAEVFDAEAFMYIWPLTHPHEVTVRALPDGVFQI